LNFQILTQISFARQFIFDRGKARLVVKFQCAEPAVDLLFASLRGSGEYLGHNRASIIATTVVPTPLALRALELKAAVDAALFAAVPTPAIADLCNEPGSIPVRGGEVFQVIVFSRAVLMMLGRGGSVEGHALGPPDD
jgi:hypothetical protein